MLFRRALALLFPLLLLPPIAGSSELVLGIANSTCDALKQAGEIFTAKTKIRLQYLCHPSGQLAKGIIEGALHIDYFLSANEHGMEEVRAAGLIDAETIRKDLGNVLVIASVPIKTGEVVLSKLADLVQPEVQHMLMGDPALAPYGEYSKEAMINAGLWERLQPRLKYNKKISMQKCCDAQDAKRDFPVPFSPSLVTTTYWCPNCPAYVPLRHTMAPLAAVYATPPQMAGRCVGCAYI